MQWLVDLADLFGASQYAAHSLCLSSDPVIINLFLLFDGGIGLAYYTIALILYLVYRDRAHVLRAVIIILRDPIFLKLFAIFIVACGTTHFTEVLTLFFGVYRLDVIARGVTVAASIVTAFRLLLIIAGLSEAEDILGDVGRGGVANYVSRPLPLPNIRPPKSRPEVPPDPTPPQA